MTSTKKRNDKDIIGKLPTKDSVNKTLKSIKEDTSFEKNELAIVNFTACGNMVYCIVFETPVERLEDNISFAYKRVRDIAEEFVVYE